MRSKRARGHEGKRRKRRRCEDEKMWRWEDVKMRRCEDEKMCRWEWEDVKMWYVKMWRWADEKMRRWEDVKMSRWEDLRMRRCEDVKMWRWEDAKRRRCEDEKMWRWEDVKMRSREDEKMRRCEDVRMRRCEDEKMWRWEDVLQTPLLEEPCAQTLSGKKKRPASAWQGSEPLRTRTHLTNNQLLQRRFTICPAELRSRPLLVDPFAFLATHLQFWSLLQIKEFQVAPFACFGLVGIFLKGNGIEEQADLDPILKCANKIQQVAGARSTAANLACGGNGVNELFGKAWEVVSTCRLLLTLHASWWLVWPFWFNEAKELVKKTGETEPAAEKAEGGMLAVVAVITDLSQRLLCMASTATHACTAKSLALWQINLLQAHFLHKVCVRKKGISQNIHMMQYNILQSMAIQTLFLYVFVMVHHQFFATATTKKYRTGGLSPGSWLHICRERRAAGPAPKTLGEKVHQTSVDIDIRSLICSLIVHWFVHWHWHWHSSIVIDGHRLSLIITVVMRNHNHWYPLLSIEHWYPCTSEKL